MEENVKFVFVAPQNTIGIRFLELKDDPRVIYMKGSCRTISNRILRFIKAAHTSTRVNRVVNLPFKWIWGNNLKKIDWKKGTKYYVIFSQGACSPLSPGYLKELQNRYDISYVIILYDFFDSVYARAARYYMNVIPFKYIFSFDPSDCKKYGFIYFNCHYSVIPELKAQSLQHNKSYDLYFAGTDKGRIDFIHDIFCSAHGHGASTLFRVSEVRREKCVYDDIIYNESIQYQQVLSESINGNCILEIIAEGQSGVTLRYYEAVCYNLKLLTTNQAVVDLPFYDPRYIHVFKTTSDIDWEWVKEDIDIDYRYDGMFSPVHLLDMILDREGRAD